MREKFEQIYQQNDFFISRASALSTNEDNCAGSEQLPNIACKNLLLNKTQIQNLNWFKQLPNKI